MNTIIKYLTDAKELAKLCHWLLTRGYPREAWALLVAGFVLGVIVTLIV